MAKYTSRSKWNRFLSGSPSVWVGTSTTAPSTATSIQLGFSKQWRIKHTLSPEVDLLCRGWEWCRVQNYRGGKPLLLELIIIVVHISSFTCLEIHIGNNTNNKNGNTRICVNMWIFLVLYIFIPFKISFSLKKCKEVGYNLETRH